MKKMKTENGNTFAKIYAVVKQIPKGKVTTYGRVAAMAGNPRWSQVVGYALHGNPDPKNIPCHRVVNKQGRLATAFVFGGENAQAMLLENEGVEVKDGFVDLDKYLWEP